MKTEHTPEPWESRAYISRFWSRVDVKGDNDCWEWTRGTTRDGYGVFHFGNSSMRAHRFSYQQNNGRITEHECVLHSCDNPRCVNPKHLWIGTRAENNADKESKKRGVHPSQMAGESNTNAVLTTPEVIAARVMNRKGLPQARIAKLLGVSSASVCMILNGERRVEETERRVSACVNACAGIETFMLEMLLENKRTVMQDLDDLTNQRDELLKALEFYADPIRYRGPNQLSDGTDKFTPNEMCYLIDVTRDCGNIAKTAIASVKGETK